MSKTVAAATISTQCGFTNGAPVNCNLTRMPKGGCFMLA